MREHCNFEELEAHKILDLVRSGVDAPSGTISRALLVTGDAVGLNDFRNQRETMNLLHIKEPRCAGRDPKLNGNICPVRLDCGRHRQLAIDRKLGIDQLSGIQVMNLPYVPGNQCRYHVDA